MESDGQSGSPNPAKSVSSPERNDDLRRKRARDRKSQQAMRDRTKYTVQNLTEQVKYLLQLVDEKEKHNGTLQSTLKSFEAELEHTKIENGALRLKLMGQPTRITESSSTGTLQRWQKAPANTVPTCMADQIIQDFLASGRSGEADYAAAIYTEKPNLCTLLDQSQRPADALSRIVGDIILSYKEIETLPKQVSLFHAFTALLKWQLLLDEASWEQVPVFFRPTQLQLTTPHAAWIDRVSWPSIRNYLIRHPSITIDDFAIVYSTNFNISWPYTASHVILVAGTNDEGGDTVHINPVFQEHIQQISNWTVTEAFRSKFPDMADLVDADTRAV